MSKVKLWNMNMAMLGIQFGWGLQMANMSAIYESLGAKPEEIGLLWLAAPMSGLLVQPVVGALSDGTWGVLGRRRPYILLGGIMSSLGLYMMPSAGSVMYAALLLWIVDVSINVSMEPMRALVADTLKEEERTAGYVMQSVMIGLGACLSSGLPYILSRLGVSGSRGGIPVTVKYSYQIGAIVFLVAVLWTVVSSQESAPVKQSHRHIWQEIITALSNMPKTMKQLAVVQMCTWLGLFCMWLFFGIAIARHVFGASDPTSAEYRAGVEWGGVCFGGYSIVCFLVAFLLPQTARLTSHKTVHSIALGLGGLGLVSVYWIENPYLLLLSMVGVGIAWASILSMPYVMLSNALPADRMGVYLGVFNFFIVIPELIAALTLKHLVRDLLGNNTLYVVILGGVLLLIASGVVWIVDESA